MLSPKQFTDNLAAAGVDYFVGVPDSLLKDWLAYISDTVPGGRHVTAANEGNAIGIAAGYHLATGKVPCVYMQNSGLGNAVNPLTSLADPEVYSIPMLLVIGWRGEPGIKDEPQHIKQGRITPALLDVLEIPYTDDLSKAAEMIALAQKESRPVALIVHAGAFEPYAGTPQPVQGTLTREQAIEEVLATIEPSAIVVSTTGKISRELYEARKARNEPVRDFLTVGSMGHASQIALGIAMQKPGRRVYCIDGDGATIMHLGGLATAGWVAPENFRHIVLNNLAHESVGGQPSAASVIDIPAAAKALGYVSAASVETCEAIAPAIGAMGEGPALLEVKVNLMSRPDLVRPAETPVQNKKTFTDFINGAN